MGLDLVSTEDLMNLPKPEWLIEDFIAEKSTTMVYGPWGLGKSFMMLDMVLDGTTGGVWAAGGERAVSRPLKTLYIVAEGVQFWPPRIKAFIQEKGEIADENILWYPKPVQLFNPTGKGDTTPDDVLALEESIAEHRPDILVFDTWVRCTSAFGMDENSSGHVAQVYRELDRLRDTYNVAPVLVHHPKKDGSSGRGSGNQMASVERVISLKSMGENNRAEFTVHDEKGNHTEPFDDFVMRFEAVDLPDDHSAVLRYEGEVSGASGPSLNDIIYNWAKLQPGAWKPRELVAQVAPVTANNYGKALKKLVDDGFLGRTETGEYFCE